jgi:NAD(P)-dependent dehydrogenase (short-subunit alcohol dehydrogenase family)
MPSGPLRIDFTGTRVLVTGASRGIAAAIVRQFAENGARVAFGYAAAADARAGFADAAAHLAATTGAAAIDADMERPGAAKRLVDAAVSTLGGIDVVVSSASLEIHAGLLDVDADALQRQVQINLVATVELIQAVLPGMRAQAHGRIITIGSVQEVGPSTMMPIYAMTKAAQENLVRNLAISEAPHGITVNNVAPGVVDTDRNAHRRQDPALWQAIIQSVNPMGRAAVAEEIAPAALYLASDAAAFVTGATLYITGGGHLPRAWRKPG